MGVAQLIWHRYCGNDRHVTEGKDLMKGSYLGPDFSEREIETYLEKQGAPFHRLARRELLHRTAGLLAEGKVVGWFAGRMEFGPRALGSRSILGDPRNPGMQAQMNIKMEETEHG